MQFKVLQCIAVQCSAVQYRLVQSYAVLYGASAVENCSNLRIIQQPPGHFNTMIAFGNNLTKISFSIIELVDKDKFFLANITLKNRQTLLFDT